jgi:hypothetical protein
MSPADRPEAPLELGAVGVLEVRVKSGIEAELLGAPQDRLEAVSGERPAEIRERPGRRRHRNGVLHGDLAG